jgi:archaeal flagellar protein FlaI
VADTSPVAVGWTIRPTRPEPRSIVELIRSGTLDARLAATVWLLVGARVPLVIAAPDRGAGKTTLLEALLDFLDPSVSRVDLAGADETFGWLPQASELGWPGPVRTGEGTPIRPDSTILVATELSDHLPVYTWGERARVAVRATAIGYALAATIHAASLDEVFEALGRPPVAVTPDELSYLGCVLVLRRLDGGRRRVVAAHYIRPTVRDAHGHTQRLGPAVLATWEPSQDAFEDFSWGIAPELAFRIRERPGDFEHEVERRRELLDGLVEAGVTGVEAVCDALRRYLATSSVGQLPATDPN